ncbi:hypothetical protein B0A50_00725 [Salinomyces thailandicus]|uniref:Uncharacterized protein n=1 Tax=Salinomyces thailandicus TaxID=706561 RepID=A0A4U0UEA5_9PEZI|nr:hypothetical protein B0A50_00725 [Salinomyces thailandica]
MASSRASSVYSTDTPARRPPPSQSQPPQQQQQTYLDYRPSGVSTYSRQGSYRAAKEYAEGLSGRRGAERGDAVSRDVSLGPGGGGRSDTSDSFVSGRSGSGSMTSSRLTAEGAPSEIEDLTTAAGGLQGGAAQPAVFVQAPGPGPGPASRQSSRQSSRPSFMNYQAPVSERRAESISAAPAAPAAARPVTPEVPVKKAVPSAGLLLVISAGAMHERTRRHVEILLKKRIYTGIAVMGLQEHEGAVMELKMDVWGLIGRLGRQMGVRTALLADLGEESVVKGVSEAVEGWDLDAVLCNLEYPKAASGRREVSGIDREELERSWRSSVGFLQTVAKSTLPLLKPGSSVNAEAGLTFLLTEKVGQSPATLMSKAACDVLLQQLQTEYSQHGMTIAHADRVLIPEPEPEPEPKLQRKPSAQAPPPIHTNGFVDAPDFTAGESPTKLWNMWALQQEIGD